MKSIAIFMLVGLSLFSNGLCSEEATDPSCGCMTAAFKGKTDLLNNVINVVCDYDAMKPGAEANTQLIAAVSEKLKTILAPTGCLTKAIDDLESGVGITAKVVSSLDSLGLVSIVRNVVCRVLRRVPVVQCVGNLLDVDKTVEGVTNLAGSILNPLMELKCASLNPQSTLDQIIKPLDQLCPGLGQTLITVKQDIMKLPAELQKVAEKTCVSALVGERQDSLSPAPNRLVGAIGNVLDIMKLPAELQKVAEKTSVGALVGERQDSLSPAPNRHVGTIRGVLVGLTETLSRVIRDILGDKLGVGSLLEGVDVLPV